MIAILGAAGAIGKAAARALAGKNEPVRAAGRHRDRLAKAFGHLPVELVAADLETPAGAARAVAGADTAVMTIGLPYPEFQRYPPMMRNVVTACEAAGVRRFLLVTNIYPYGRPQTPVLSEEHPLEPCSFKGRMRLEQERILKSSRLPWIALRLPDFWGPEAELSYARTIFEAALAGKPAQLFSPADLPHQFVHTADTGAVIAALLARDDGWNEVYHFAGSGLITVDDFARRVYAAAGEPYRRRLAGPLLLRLAGIFQPLMREFVEMQYLQETPVNISDAKLARHIGEPARTSYDEGIPATLAAQRILVTANAKK